MTLSMSTLPGVGSPSRPLRSSLATVAPGLGVATLAFALWYGAAAARALPTYPF